MKSISEITIGLLARGIAIANAPKKELCSDAVFAAFIALAIAICALYLPDMAYATGAAGPGVFKDTLCAAVNLINQIGTPIATVAVIVLGVGALLGKVSWGMAILVCLGIAVVFGAGSIVEFITSASGNGGTACGQ